MSFKRLLLASFLFGFSLITGFCQVVEQEGFNGESVRSSDVTKHEVFLKSEIIITHFLPINGGVYEPKKKLNFQVETYERNFVRGITSVYFVIDNKKKEAVYDAQLNRWMANVFMPSFEGDYIVKAVATDNTGGKKISEITVTVREKIDNQIPELSFHGINDGDFIETDEDGLILLDFAASDADGKIENISLRIDNGKENIFLPTSDGTYSAYWRPLSLGNHTLTMEASDNLGAIASKSINLVVVTSQFCYSDWRSDYKYYTGDRVSCNGRNYVAFWDNFDENPELFSSNNWDGWGKLSLCLFNKASARSFNSEESIVQRALKDMVVFPNPAFDVIHFDKQFVAMEVEIFDLTGKKIINTSILPGYNSVDISQLSTGLYSMVFKLGDVSIQKPFVKSGY